MKKFYVFLMSAAVCTGCFLTGCDETEHVPVPVAPILKDVVLPEKTTVMPGSATQIKGKGFSQQDKIILKGTETYEIIPTEVTDDYTEFTVPREAAGNYTVTVERDGKQTVLDNPLQVPYVILLEDVAMPSAPAAQKSRVTVGGKGFETGDELVFSAPHYPAGITFSATATATEADMSFELPDGMYGVNQLIVYRGERTNNIGYLTVATNVGDELGGGIVYWVDAGKAHGYIAAKTNAGTPVEQFGPEVDPADAAGTSQAMGSGKANTAATEFTA